MPDNPTDNPAPAPADLGPAHFGARIRRERLRLGLTTRAAAALLGTSQGTYTTLESSSTAPRYATIVRLVDRVGMRGPTLAPELAAPRTSTASRAR